MKVFNALAILAVLLFSALGGAAAIVTYQVPIATFDASNNAKLVVDYIALNDAAGNEVGKFTNVQRVAFVVEDVGEYAVLVHKTGYADKREPVFVEEDGPTKLPTLNIKLTPLPSPPPPSGGTGETGETGQTGGTTSSGIVIKSLDFEDETKPNADVEFTVELKNLWVGTDGKGIDAEEVTAYLAIRGIDDGSDLTEELEFGTIDYKDTEEQSVTMRVPVDAEDKEFNVVMTLSWENSDGAAFQSTTPVTKKLSVERADHDVAITNVEFESDTVTVGSNSQAAVSLANIGSDDESVKVSVRSDVLGLNEVSPTFKLRESKETTQYVPFSVTKDVKTGNYPATITVYFGSGESATQSVVLAVRAKAVPQAQEPVTVVPVTTTVQQAADETQEAARKPADVNVLAGFAVLVLVLLIVSAFMARQQPSSVIVEKRRGGK